MKKIGVMIGGLLCFSVVAHAGGGATIGFGPGQSMDAKEVLAAAKRIAGAAAIPGTAVKGLVSPAAMNSDSAGPICVGDRVYHAVYRIGTVKEIFSDGTAKVDFPSQITYIYLNISSLAKAARCTNDSGGCSN